MLESGTGMFRWLADRRMKQLSAYDVIGDTHYPLTKTKARMVGGTSNFWTGRTERLHPSDFEPHPYTPKDNPWPITYQELDPHYEWAEKILRVRGYQNNPHSPPRKKPFPFHSRANISYLKDKFGEVGVDVYETPTATPAKTFRFFNVQKEILPSFKGKLISGVTVTKIHTTSDGEVKSVTLKTLKGEEYQLHADIFVVCCGGIDTPRLLLQSKSKDFPDGLGNSSGWVGRCFNEHPAVNFYAKINHERRTLIPTDKLGRTHQLYSHFRSEGLGSILPVFRQGWILPHHQMPFRAQKISRAIRSLLSRFQYSTLYIGATIEQKPLPENRVVLSKHRFDCFENPIAELHFNYAQQDLQLLERCREMIKEMYAKLGAKDVFESDITWSCHHQGTCRMGADPKTSVVDENLKLHESPNLYLCGSEVFVTGGAMQPVLTITALAHRLGKFLAKALSYEDPQRIHKDY